MSQTGYLLHTQKKIIMCRLEDLDFNTCIKLINAYFLFITEYDTDGNVVQSWHSTDPMMSKICEGFLHNGYMYLGSPYNMFAARVPYYH